MTRTLLLRGMLAGFAAGLVIFAFARWTAEPQVDRAIGFEASMDQAKGESPEPEMVSRKIQRGIGLLTGAVVYSSALGGIFGLVFGARWGVQSSCPGTLDCSSGVYLRSIGPFSEISGESTLCWQSRDNRNTDRGVLSCNCLVLGLDDAFAAIGPSLHAAIWSLERHPVGGVAVRVLSCHAYDLFASGR